MAHTYLTHKLSGAVIGCAFSLVAFGTPSAHSQTRNSESPGGIPCKMAYQSPTADVSVLDHTDSDNASVGDVNMLKSCAGPVVGTFSAEITGNLHIHEFRAICIEPGGVPGGCTRGQVFNQRVHSLLAPTSADEVSRPVETIRWVWPNIPPGKWRFRLFPASFAPLTVKRRTFTVEAFKSGPPG